MGRIFVLSLMCALFVSGGLFTQTTSHAEPYKSRLGVTAREWNVTLSRASVKSPVQVEFQNFGEDKHNLWFRQGKVVKKFRTAEPGVRTRQVLNLKKGKWTVYCELPGHKMAGMRTTLIVK